jgi:hypothetical protein
MAEDSNDGSKFAVNGVKGFAEQNIHCGRKVEGNFRRSKSLDERESSSLPLSKEDYPNPVANVDKWQCADDDVEFIATGSGLDTAFVKSMYLEQHASVP